MIPRLGGGTVFRFGGSRRAMDSASVEVSVIIPAYNASATLSRAIEGLLSQSFQGWEAIIVNDNSHDDTVICAEALCRQDQRVRLINLPNNVGPGGARNVGVSQAVGVWLALLDADDSWDDRRLETLLNAAASARRAPDLIADGIMGYDASSGETTGRYMPSFRADELGLCDLLRGDLNGGRIDAGFLKPLIRKDFLKREGLTYVSHVRHGEDYILYFEALCRRAHFVLINEPLYIYTMPISRVGGRLSPFSHTVTDGKKLGANLAAAAQRHLADLSKPEVARLEQKLRELDTIDHWWAFERLVQGGRSHAALGLLFRPGVLSQLLRRLRYKLLTR